MTVHGVLGEGRAAALARMTETVEFYTDATVVNDATLATSTTKTVLWSGPARVKYVNAVARDVDPGAQAMVVGSREVHVPVGSVTALPGVLVGVTASTVDESLVGRVFRVAERPDAGQVSAWRYPVDEVTG